METVFVYIWEYWVNEANSTSFEKAYGPEGAWVKLFSKAKGYIRTDLHKDIANPQRFITVDFWKSKEDRDNFKIQFSEEFKQLDEACEAFTEEENFIGDFDSFIKKLIL